MTGDLMRTDKRWLYHSALTTAAVAMLALLCSPQCRAAIPDYIAKAVADGTRPADDRELDGKRKPAETLNAAGVKPGMVVGEYLPGGGYYTRLLSDVVGPKGRVYALETSTWGDKNVDATKAVLAEPGRGNVK